MSRLVGSSASVCDFNNQVSNGSRLSRAIGDNREKWSHSDFSNFYSVDFMTLLRTLTKYFELGPVV